MNVPGLADVLLGPFLLAVLVAGIAFFAALGDPHDHDRGS